MFNHQTWKFLRASLLLLIVSFVSACSDGGTKKSEQVIGPDLSEYKKASCSYGFSEGGIATARKSRIISTYFGKKINVGHLESVLGASAAEVVRFGEKLNVKFYKATAYDSKNCEFLSPLPMAPSELNARFAEGSENTLGLYLPRQSPDLKSTRNHAAILVRRDGNKWVLVHEYMHHLFQMQVETQHGHRDSKGEFLSVFDDLLTRLKKLESYASTSKSLYAKELKSASKKMAEVNNLAIDFMKEYLLEEIAIETILGGKFDSKELNYVVEGQRLNGAAYILTSGNKAKDIFKPLRELSNIFIGDTSSGLTTVDLEPIRRSLQQFSRLEDEITRLQSWAREYIKAKGLVFKEKSLVLSLTSGLVDSAEPYHVGCSHQQDVDEILAVIGDSK